MAYNVLSLPSKGVADPIGCQHPVSGATKSTDLSPPLPLPEPRIGYVLLNAQLTLLPNGLPHYGPHWGRLDWPATPATCDRTRTV